MEQAECLSLIERLSLVAQLWVEKSDATHARLGRAVINDGGYFSRIERNPATTTVTLERFARFFGDAANWPNCELPPEAAAFACVVGLQPSEPSSGRAPETAFHSEGAAPAIASGEAA